MFQIAQRGSTVARELIGGVSTFMGKSKKTDFAHGVCPTAILQESTS